MPQADLSLSELELRLLYSIIVAGKSAKFTEGVMTRLHLLGSPAPFQVIRQRIKQNRLEGTLREARSGNYTKIAKSFRELVSRPLDLRTCTVEQLEAIHGIGPKTARFFILWTRPGERYAALDVHVLRWMRQHGYDAPKTTPSGAKYRVLETAFIAEADKRNMTARELDAEIWETGSQRMNQPVPMI